jgi:hypothetical protein
MAIQLREVLDRFADQTAPVSINQMAQEMQLSPGVLHSMIDYWVHRGKLREVNCAGQTCPTCGMRRACPFVVTIPRYYELVRDEDAPLPPAYGETEKKTSHL